MEDVGQVTEQHARDLMAEGGWIFLFLLLLLILFTWL